jgi:enoyl-CoA hydratase/carnithine racemase
MAQAYETITVSWRDDVVDLCLNRPNCRNALSRAMLQELTIALADITAQGAIGVLLRGAGTAFCAGADIKELKAIRDGPSSGDEARALAHLAKRLMAIIESSPFPVIACVDGAAFGGGLELALSCDVIYATERSGFAFPETTLGLIPGFGRTRRIIERAGMGVASDLLILGRNMEAREALRRSLIARVFKHPEALVDAETALTTVPPRSHQAIALARSALRAAIDLGREDAFTHESHLYAIAFRAPPRSWYWSRWGSRFCLTMSSHRRYLRDRAQGSEVLPERAATAARQRKPGEPSRVWSFVRRPLADCDITGVDEGLDVLR